MAREFTDWDDGGEGQWLAEYTCMGLAAYFFADLGDLTRGLEAATILDDDTTNLYWRCSDGKQHIEDHGASSQPASGL